MLVTALVISLYLFMEQALAMGAVIGASALFCAVGLAAGTGSRLAVGQQVLVDKTSHPVPVDTTGRKNS